MSWYNPKKLQLDSMYGTFVIHARGHGRIQHIGERYGFDQLIMQAVRLQLRCPLGCPDIERWIDRLLLERDYGCRYYHTKDFDPHAVTLRRAVE